MSNRFSILLSSALFILILIAPIIELPVNIISIIFTFIFPTIIIVYVFYQLNKYGVSTRRVYLSLVNLILLSTLGWKLYGMAGISITGLKIIQLITFNVLYPIMSITALIVYFKFRTNKELNPKDGALFLYLLAYVILIFYNFQPTFASSLIKASPQSWLNDI